MVHLAHHWRLITLDLSNCVLLTNDGLQHVKGMPHSPGPIINPLLSVSAMLQYCVNIAPHGAMLAPMTLWDAF